ncbi:MAG: GMC oxidoreductase [Myxococcota bacterium]
MSESENYDVIIIGSGAGGGTLARRLAPSGKRILILERGPFLPREKGNWTFRGSFNYYSREVMVANGQEVMPGFVYHVGGNTKVYGAALFRLRKEDFGAVKHVDGVSPAWPVGYDVFEPYYTEAERMYQVHGTVGEDPCEPPRSEDYAHAPISHEPRIAEIFDALKEKGLRPFRAPMGIQLDEERPELSACIRCDTCDGYPCLVHAKSDAEVCGVRPALEHPNVTLMTGAHVQRILTNQAGTEATGVEAEVDGETVRFEGGIVAVACGAVNSAALLLRSATDMHPRGLANGSDQVGRNLMKHVLGMLLGVSRDTPNPTAFQKTMAVNDYYFGEPGFDYPMGNIQLMGRTNVDALRGQEAKYAPLTIEHVAQNSVDWWLTTEDLPDPENRVWVQGDRIHIAYRENNTAAFDRLTQRWTEVLGSIGCACDVAPAGHYFNPHEVDAPDTRDDDGYYVTKMPASALGHQVGTCRFGRDPATSVLNEDCRAHEVDRLYVVDGSFFVSSAAVNPTLTIIANALRVGDHLLQRLI